MDTSREKYPELILEKLRPGDILNRHLYAPAGKILLDKGLNSASLIGISIAAWKSVESEQHELQNGRLARKV